MLLELNPELQAVILAGVTFLVTEGLKALSNLLGFDLSGAGAAITAGVMAFLLAVLGGVFALIPPEFHEIASIIQVLLVAILGSFGVHRQFKRR